MCSDNLSKKQIVQEMDSSFIEVALEDIKRALDPSVNTNLAVFILGVCLIDALAGFYGGKVEPTNDGNKVRFKEFIKKYLKQYSYDDLLEARNGLLHSYATKKYCFVNKKRYLHGKSINGRMVINDENFYDDLRTAYENFKKDILDDSNQEKVYKNCKKRLVLGLMKIASSPVVL